MGQENTVRRAGASIITCPPNYICRLGDKYIFAQPFTQLLCSGVLVCGGSGYLGRSLLATHCAFPGPFADNYGQYRWDQ